MATVQNVNWLASNIETDTTHRLVTDEQIEKWNKASENKYVEITTDRLDLDTLPPGKWYWKWKYDSETGEEIANQIYGSVRDSYLDNDNYKVASSIMDLINKAMIKNDCHDCICSLHITTDHISGNKTPNHKIIINTSSTGETVDNDGNMLSSCCLNIGTLYEDYYSIAEGGYVYIEYITYTNFSYRANFDYQKYVSLHESWIGNGFAISVRSPMNESNPYPINASIQIGLNDNHESIITSSVPIISSLRKTRTLNIFGNIDTCGLYYIDSYGIIDKSELEFLNYDPDSDIPDGILLVLLGRHLYFPEKTNIYYVRYYDSGWTDWKRVNII